MTPYLAIDGYKLGHREQYPDGTNFVFSNFTPRKSRRGQEKVVFFGLQYFLISYYESWKDEFFDVPFSIIEAKYKSYVSDYLGKVDASTGHLKDLHDLGYMPLNIWALPEGSQVNIGVPCLVIYNTHPDFFWLPNYIETIISSQLWGMCTSATTAYEYRKVLDFYAEKTSCNPDFVEIQGHDFSFRGMFGQEAAASSGASHLLSFVGTDTIPAIEFINNFYFEKPRAFSIPATEHSVMSAGGKDNEEETIKRLITQVYPSGPVSIVSDTWDFWNTINNTARKLKNIIMRRDGVVVFRPDSGNPVDIICGFGSKYQSVTAQEKGAVEVLWDIFGGKINSKGYKELDCHVGLIYGDSITIQRAEEICERLEKKGFSSTSIVFGIGSYTYQHVTRDTDGYAMKATYCEVNGKGRDIFKDPVTDDGTKRSAKGILVVNKVGDDFILTQQAKLADLENSAMKLVSSNGSMNFVESFRVIKSRLLGK